MIYLRQKQKKQMSTTTKKKANNGTLTSSLLLDTRATGRRSFRVKISWAAYNFDAFAQVI
jgi:hypothetical protein